MQPKDKLPELQAYWKELGQHFSRLGIIVQVVAGQEVTQEKIWGKLPTSEMAGLTTHAILDSAKEFFESGQTETLTSEEKQLRVKQLTQFIGVIASALEIATKGVDTDYRIILQRMVLQLLRDLSTLIASSTIADKEKASATRTT